MSKNEIKNKMTKKKREMKRKIKKEKNNLVYYRCDGKEDELY